MKKWFQVLRDLVYLKERVEELMMEVDELKNKVANNESVTVEPRRTKPREGLRYNPQK